MKALIIGGTGWVGHKIALDFAGAGHDTTICSRGEMKTFAENVSGIGSIKADKHDEEQLKKILETKKYDIVIDTVPARKCIEGIHKYAKSLKHYIHCSSTGGYAPLPFVPGDETMPYQGGAGDGWKQKAEVDAQVINLFMTHGFPATVIRPSYITGPGMLPLDNLGGRRQDFIHDILAGKILDLPNDGQALLHPVHVSDLARSFLLAAEVPMKSIGQVYNICLDRAVTLNRYMEITAGAFGARPRLNHMPLEDMIKKHVGHTSEIGLRFVALHMCFDISKAREHLGYHPARSTEEAIEETALWAARQ